MPEARTALFQALEVTAVINGAEIRKTRVWPEISAPFCLVFARNQRPPPGSGFRFVTPRIESALNESGAWRIDVSSSNTVTNEQVCGNPTILKTLFRGSSLDLEILDRIAATKWPTLREYWSNLFGLYRNRPQCTGNGYQRLRKTSRIRQRDGDGLPGVSAKYLHGLAELDVSLDDYILIKESSLRPFRRERIHDPRRKEIFQGPLLLVKESPPAHRGRIKVSVSQGNVVYNQSYHGYSAAEHSDGRELILYLALLISSTTALWYALMTSGRFGFEREVVEKIVLDSVPVPPLETLSVSRRSEIQPLFAGLAADGDERAWDDVDEWVGSLFGLTKVELQVITDTLRYNLPFAENRKNAHRPPSCAQMDQFMAVLSEELSEWAAHYGQSVSVRSATMDPRSPWRFVQLGSDFDGENHDFVDPVKGGLVQAANMLAASEIVIVDDAPACLACPRLVVQRLS